MTVKTTMDTTETKKIRENWNVFKTHKNLDKMKTS